MMIVRPFESSDQQAIEAMKTAQGFSYESPDWERMLVSSVVEIDGRPAMAAFLRKTAETYLVFDPAADFRKRERLGQLLVLHKEMRNACLRENLTDVHCWLPPAIESFGVLLENPSFGWRPAPWPKCYVKEVK